VFNATAGLGILLFLFNHSFLELIILEKNQKISCIIYLYKKIKIDYIFV